eukprot:10316030-Alexandrium_andersonii.AAC.1
MAPGCRLELQPLLGSQGSLDQNELVVWSAWRLGQQERRECPDRAAARSWVNSGRGQHRPPGSTTGAT